MEQQSMYQSPVATASSETEQEQVERMEVSDSKPETSLDRQDAEEAEKTTHKCNSSSSPSPPSSPVLKKEPASPSAATHPMTMPAFMSVLNLQPATEEKKGASSEYEEEMDAPSTLKSATLLGRYQQDPGSVLELLKSCLSVDKLATLVKAEYRSDTEKLTSLQTQLEEAYETLKSCNEKKEGLNIMVTETNERIRTKRKQLEGIREELRELGEEELKLKRRRDETASKCLGIKRKLQASREAIQQISELTAKKPDGVASLAGTSALP